jgi:TRAP-type C4-dicarboxylate transport system substrate-binding protein
VVEVGYPWPGTYGGRIPEAFIETGLPFSLSNPSEIQTLFWRKGWVDILREAYAANNLYYAGFIVQAPVPVVSKVPINSLADLKKLKVRSVGGPPAEVVAELGAAYTYISFGEVYMALMLGTIDAAAAGSIMEEYDLKLYELCPYYLRPDLVSYQVGPVVVNMDAWNSLTPDLQEIIIAAAQVWARNIEMREWEACVNCWVDWQTNWKGEKCYIPDSELPEVYAAAARVWEKYGAATPACGEMIDILKDYMRSLGYLE